MVYRSEKDVIQNLQDAGCNKETIDQFMDCLKRGTRGEQLQILSQQRKKLLDSVHAELKRIDCLDYLVYQLQKNANGKFRNLLTER